MWQFLQLIVEMDNSSCQTACGMVGSCDGNADNDMPFNKMTTNVADIAFRASYASLLPVEQSLFSINSDDLDLAQLTKAGYSLSLNTTAGTSDPLTNTPTSYGGILFSYAYNKTFALSNDYNITIHCGQTSISTVTTNTLDAWNQIILTDERDAGRLQWSITSVRTAVSSMRRSARGRSPRMQHDVDCPDLVDVGGRLSLGSWQGAPEATRLQCDDALTHLCEIAGSGTVDYYSLMCGMSVSSYPE